MEMFPFFENNISIPPIKAEQLGTELHAPDSWMDVSAIVLPYDRVCLPRTAVISSSAMHNVLLRKNRPISNAEIIEKMQLIIKKPIIIL